MRRKQTLLRENGSWELRLYERLGIRQFRQLLFLLERLRHRTDGRQNENYHLRTLTAASAANFTPELRYHTLLHTASLALLAVGLVLKYSAYPAWSPLELPVYLMGLLNIWCILLQRYNFLRIRLVCSREADRRARSIRQQTARLLSAVPGGYGQTLMAADWQLLVRMQQEQPHMVFTEDDAAGLLRLAALLEQAGFGCGEVQPKSGGSPWHREAVETGAVMRIRNRLDRRTARTAEPTCLLLAADAQAASALCRLFGTCQPGQVRQRLLVLRRYLETVRDGEE